MTNDLVPNLSLRQPGPEDLKAIYKLLGEPPLFSSEDEEAYDGIMLGLLASIRPKDFLETMMVKRMADEQWEIQRGARHKVLTIERRFLKRLEVQAFRVAFQAQQRKAAAPDTEDQATSVPVKVTRMYELEEFVLQTPVAVDEILNQTPEDLDHARAMETGMDHYLNLDAIIDRATARQANGFNQLQKYREFSNRQTRDTSDEIIVTLPDGGENNPALVPAEPTSEASHDLDKKN
jgi:hypothetical protein